jgi:hypothetical protein
MNIPLLSTNNLSTEKSAGLVDEIDGLKKLRWNDPKARGMGK